MCTVQERQEAMVKEIAGIIGDKNAAKVSDCIKIYAEEMIKVEDELKAANAVIEDFEAEETKRVMAEAEKTLARATAANLCFLDALIPGESKIKDSLKLKRRMGMVMIKSELAKGSTDNIFTEDNKEKAISFFKLLKKGILEAHAS